MADRTDPAAKPDATPPVERKPTRKEDAALKERLDRRRAQRPAPPLKLVRNDDGASSLNIDHPDIGVGVELLGNALGCLSSDALQGYLDQLVSVFSRNGEPDVKAINFAIKSIASIAPRDELEAMLALQMATTHALAISHMKSVRRVDLLSQLEVYDRSANKLMRTFTAQLEALRKHRSGGQQKVEVRHVHVNEGGKAIIGNVDAGGGEKPKR